jgi:hypothetical protein
MIRFTLPATVPTDPAGGEAGAVAADPEPAAEDQDVVPADRTAGVLASQPVAALTSAEEPAP